MLDEMAGVGDGHESEVAVDPVPGVVEGAGEESFVPKAVDQEDWAGDRRGSRGGEGPPCRFAGVTRVVGLVIIQRHDTGLKEPLVLVGSAMVAQPARW